MFAGSRAEAETPGEPPGGGNEEDEVGRRSTQAEPRRCWRHSGKQCDGDKAGRSVEPGPASAIEGSSGVAEEGDSRPRRGQQKEALALEVFGRPIVGVSRSYPGVQVPTPPSTKRLQIYATALVIVATSCGIGGLAALARWVGLA